MNSLKFSVVIPVYNSERVVSETVSRICLYFSNLNAQYEIVLVNDGSTDSSWPIIKSLALANRYIIAINLIKNFGQHNANMCGLRASSGDYIITMDDDLQNPPEEISKLIEKVGSNYDLVIGKFRHKKHSFIRVLGSKGIGFFIRRIFEVKPNLVLSNFRMVRRDVVDRVCKDKSYSPYIPGLFLKYSASPVNVEVRHDERAHGKSNYSVKKILRLTASILFNHSAIPLRFVTTLGFLIAMFSFILGFYFMLSAMINGTHVPGWASLVVLLSFFNGLLILILSVLGEYMVRILREVNVSSSYEVKEMVCL